MDEKDTPPPALPPKEKVVGSVVRVENLKTLGGDVKQFEFKVYRDNPNDTFKPTSDSAIKSLARLPIKHSLKPEDEQLLQSVAADLERSLSIEEIVTLPYKDTKLNFEAFLAIEKLPSWLRSMIKARYPAIQSYFKNDTTKFLKNLATKIEQRDAVTAPTYGGYQFPPEEDTFKMEEKDVEEVEPTFFEKGGGFTAVTVVEAVGKWKRQKDIASAWDKAHISYAAEKLRQGLSMRAGAHDLLVVEQDTNIVQSEGAAAGAAGGGGGGDEDESTDEDEEQKPKWESMFPIGQLEQEAEESIGRNLELTTEAKIKPVQTTKELIAEEKKKKSNKKSVKPSFLLPKINWTEGKNAKSEELKKRGHFRRYSKLFYTGCGDTVPAPERLEHHHRADESFHQFCVVLVAWKWFQGFIMFLIFVNATILAVETFEIGENAYVWFDMFDEFFLAVYLVEAMIKIYAHPFRYWMSGFNVFDFIIIFVSVVKSTIDWLNVAEIAFLRVFLIVRALRVLRSISLSIQLQVLVTALFQTIKKHVLSVVILLSLLIYIAAIVAFYLFAEKVKEVWGFVPRGMLRMIAYVTLDGWTDLQKEFEARDLVFEGRVFNLICIILGNFMFSNIFIAIIIFNISEATDLFRERIRAERETIVRRKKISVFRRQKLDMRQLLARQKNSFSADFFLMASEFQKLLRHDDLVAMREICTSPLWIDAAYQALMRTGHTSNILLNLHREMADNLLEIHRVHKANQMEEETISRGRYNRYMKIKAKLALIKREILRFREPPSKKPLMIRFENKDKANNKK